MSDVFLGAELGADVPETDLHGMGVKEAEEVVERLIHAAFMHGDRVIRIIHGQGTGALREAVRGLLRGHVNVRASRTDAGVSYAEIERR